MLPATTPVPQAAPPNKIAARGLHILATFSAGEALLRDMEGCRACFHQAIATLNLHSVGEVFHPFSEAGFTAVVCLTESHAAIHTWPEHGIATFDVFLSNLTADNSAKTRRFYDMVIAHFQATDIRTTEAVR